MVTIVCFIVFLYGLTWYRFATRKVRYAVNRTASMSNVPKKSIACWVIKHKATMNLVEYESFIDKLSEASRNELKDLLLDLSHYAHSTHVASSSFKYSQPHSNHKSPYI